jgi:hypothetical protein
MSRPIFVVLFLAFALQISQSQLSSHGAPASVVSPTSNGVQHGAPASVVSPTTRPPGVHPTARPFVRIHGPVRRFGSQRARQQVFVPVPLFYPIYGDGGYPSVADPYTPDASAAADPAPANQNAADQNGSSDDDLRAAYLQGAHDAMTQQSGSRYGEHYLDSREKNREQAEADSSQGQKARASQNSDFSVVPVEDKTPATVFIFKDGHQFETKNYAIMGGTLFDFSGSTLKKIKLDDLDSSATVKANDDRGVALKLQ